MASEQIESKNDKRKKAVIMSNDRALQMIQLIKNRECLWNKLHRTGINQSQVADAWKEVSIKMQLPVDFLQQKWNSLQGTFRHVRAIHEKIIATAPDAKNVRQPTWFAYRAMLFLNHVNVSRVKAESSNQQSICNVRVEANSTHEEQKYGDVNQEGLDIFANESKISKTRSFKLSHARTLQLIQLIKNRKCLWNKYHPTAINQSVDDAWKEVSIKMRLPVDFLKHRWNSLKGSYRGRKSIRAKAIAAASDGKSVRPPCWFAYESMLFLNEVSFWRVKAESSNQQSICNVTVEGNSTHEQQGEINEEASDIFTNEVKHSDNIAIDTSITETEGDSTYEEYGDVNQEGLDIFANESKVSKTRSFKLSHARTLQLIQLIKNRKCLWNKYHPTAINQSVDDAWKEVSIKMRLPVDFLKHRWNSLKGTYRRIKSIRAKPLAAASVGKSVRPPGWFAYESMLFLNEVSVWRVKAESSNQQSICNVTVEGNSTHEQQGEINEEASDIFTNEVKHSDNIAIDTSITETEGDSTYEEYGDVNQEGLDIFANESKVSKTRSFKLSHARTLQLIQLIKNRKCLWNKYHPTAINQSVDDAWKEVSIKMRLPVDFLKHRWNSLKGTYRRIKSIRAKPLAAASVGKSVRPPGWFAYESMLFLNEVSVWRVKAESSNQQSICNVTVEGNSTHEEQGEINEEASDIFTNEVKHSDNIAIDTSIPETEGDSTYKEYGDVNQEGLDIFANESKVSKTRLMPMSQNRTLQLIQLIKNRECLWSKLHRTGINRSRIANAWKEVSIKMRLPVDFVQRKWKSLQASYRTLKSIHTKRIAAASDGNSVQPRWFAYRDLMFLNQVHASRVMRQHTIPEPICHVIVEPNSTYEEHNDTDQEVSDIFANEMKHSDNIAIDTLITKTERDTTYEEHGETKEEVSNANESAYGDSIATNTASTESEGVRFGVLMARKLDNMSPIRRKRMILKLEKLLLDEEEARFVEKYGPL